MKAATFNIKEVEKELEEVSKNPIISNIDGLKELVLERLEPIDIKELINDHVASNRNKINELTETLNQAESDSEKARIQGRIDGLHTDVKKAKVFQYQILVRSVELILEKIDELGFGACVFQDQVYFFNGCFWETIDRDQVKAFIGEAAEKLGIERDKARYYLFRDKLIEQFKASMVQMEAPEPDKVSVNLSNGTFEVGTTSRELRPFCKSDFLRYQLEFEYEPKSGAPIWMNFLNEVLPDKELQDILAEYLGYVFIRGNRLKLEKVLLLYGTGANGKSVIMDVVKALLGESNMSEYGLQSLCDSKGHIRANISNKLLNYSSELSGDLSADKFKQLASGEPIEARHMYSSPFILNDYAKLMFNCNELPWRVEHTAGFFRRFLIIPFQTAIPEEKQDKFLAGKIIKDELPGVFNWVLYGLDRLLEHNKFAHSEASDDVLKQYQKESDTVQLFMEDENLIASPSVYEPQSSVYSDYRAFCTLGGYMPINQTNFKKRLMSQGIACERKRTGMVLFIEKKFVSE